jgi:bifunctional DNA-binding transcriptional regulator/antitoxin component of YhaV-PrlF toxin-antitoxin module
MSAYHVRIIEGGKIVLPAVLRRKHGFTVGQTLVVQDDEGGVTIQSLDEAGLSGAGISTRRDSAYN